MVQFLLITVTQMCVSSNDIFNVKIIHFLYALSWSLQYHIPQILISVIVVSEIHLFFSNFRSFPTLDRLGTIGSKIDYTSRIERVWIECRTIDGRSTGIM